VSLSTDEANKAITSWMLFITNRKKTGSIGKPSQGMILAGTRNIAYSH